MEGNPRDEKRTDEKLIELAESINLEAARSLATQQASQKHRKKAKAARA